MEDVPTIGLEAEADILVERQRRVPLDRDVVAVVDPAQVAELEVPGERRRLRAHALHHVAVAAQHVDVVVEQRELGLVVGRRQPALGDRHADGVAAALPERAGRGLDAGGVAVFGMAGGLGRELAELLDIVDADRRLAGLVAIGVDLLDPGQVEQRVEQHRGVADRQHEAIAVGPARIARIGAEEILPQRVADRRQRHRRAGMARIRLLDRVHRQRADRVDRRSRYRRHRPP